MGKHIVDERLMESVYAEVRRISREKCKGRTPSRAEYNRYRNKKLPETRRLLQYYPWEDICRVANITGEVAPSKPGPKAEPKAPPARKMTTILPEPIAWGKLHGPYQFISPYATKENIYALVVAMIQVAETEAAGHLGHYTNSYIDREAIQRDAIEFLKEWREAA